MADQVYRFVIQGGGGGSAPAASTAASSRSPRTGLSTRSTKPAPVSKKPGMPSIKGAMGGAKSALAAIAGPLAAVAVVVGVAAVAFAVLAKTVKQLDKTFQQMAKELAPYGGALAAAQARVEVARELQQVRRAQTMGPGLARFTTERDRLSRAVIDIKDSLLRPFIEAAGPVLTTMADAAEWVTDHGDQLEGAMNIVAEILAPGAANMIALWGRMLEIQEAEKSIRDSWRRGASLIEAFDQLSTIEMRILGEMGLSRGSEFHLPLLGMPPGINDPAPGGGGGGAAP